MRARLKTHLTKFQTMSAGVVFMLLHIALFESDTAAGWWLFALVFASWGVAIGLGVSFPQLQFFGHSICIVAKRRKVVALTFDDGPDAANTPALLALLAARNVRVTFFCIGQRVAAHSELARQIAAAGHRVENHTHRHSPFTNFFLHEKLRAELALAQTEIQSVTGRAPEFFRPPMGLTNPHLFTTASSVGLRVTGYATRGLDLRAAATSEQIVARLLRGLRPGAIFLLHDAGVPRERLLATVTLLLDKLAADGYQCARLDELIAEP
ncbi:MAG: Peptidoglycan-N-acetylglucosamine deacetylase [Verrucomicrobiota bacterium]